MTTLFCPLITFRKTSMSPHSPLHYKEQNNKEEYNHLFWLELILYLKPFCVQKAIKSFHLKGTTSNSFFSLLINCNAKPKHDKPQIWWLIIAITKPRAETSQGIIVNSELWGILSLGETYVEVVNGFNIRSFYILFTAIRSLKSWVAMI